METGFRTFTLEKSDGDGLPRGILTTEQAVEMFDWTRGEFVPEVILMSGMKARGLTIKLLDTHNTDSVRNVLGSFVDLQVKQAGERNVPHKFVDGEIRVSKTEPDIQTKLEEGHINEMSIGYRYHDDDTIHLKKGEKQIIEGKEYEGPINIRTKWEAQEASLVPIGADNQAQIRGFKSIKEAQKTISQKRSDETTDDSVTTEVEEIDDKIEESEIEPKSETETKQQHKTLFINMENKIDEAVEEKAIENGIKAGQEAFDKRADAIMAIGEEVGDAQWAISELRSGRSVEEVQSAAIKKLKEETKSIGAKTAEPLGLSKKEKRSYSITNAMRSLLSGRGVQGLEKEVSDAIADRCGRETHGFFLASQRDLVAGTATDGAELVPTDTRGGDFIDALRPNMITLQAGVRVLNGLTGDVSIPRKTATTTATFKAEVTEHSNTEPQFGSVTLTPRHLGTYTDVSKQLLAQGNPDVDALIRDDLNQAIAVALDKAVLQGAGDGSNEPGGIIAGTGNGLVAVADNTNGAPSKSELHTFMRLLDDNNALRDNCSWVMNPVIASLHKQTLIDSGVSGYRWNMDNNTIFGYNAYATSNMPDERTIFGDFSEYILGIFDGIEIVYDPFSGAKTRTVTFVLNLMCDGDVRQPKAFAVSDDGS
jgi:HK97 family phage major capsid protein